MITPDFYINSNNHSEAVIAVPPYYRLLQGADTGIEDYGRTKQHIGQREFLLLCNRGNFSDSSYSGWIAVPLDYWSF